MTGMLIRKQKKNTAFDRTSHLHTCSLNIPRAPNTVCICAGDASDNEKFGSQASSLRMLFDVACGGVGG